MRRTKLVLALVCAGAFAIGHGARGQVSPDVNSDGVLDVADPVRQSVEAQNAPTPERADQLDFNQDGILDSRDTARAAWNILRTEFGSPVDLDLTSPSQTLMVTRDSNLVVEGSVGEPSTVFVQGFALPGEINGAFSTVVQLRKGVNIIEVDAERTDGSGFARQSVFLRLDVDPPTLAITSPPTQTFIPDNVATVSGNVQDDTAVSVTVSTPAGSVEATPDAFGDFEVQVPIIQGIQDITVSVVDEVGLTNQASVRVRGYLSPAGEAVSPDGARIVLPEGAMADENMVVSLHDVSNDELESILGMTLLEGPPPEGFEGLGDGVIVMPAGMMLEVTGAPDNGDPLFQRPVDISIPNVTGEGNDVPMWIFSVSPDIDGDGVPQLAVVSRARVSEDGLSVIPITEMEGPADEVLPGFMNPENERFEENQLNQVAAARAVREAQARLSGDAPALKNGPNVLAAKPEPKFPEKAPIKPEPIEPILAESLPRGPGGVLLVDDYEDGDLVNKLTPAGSSYVVVDDLDPIAPNPLLPEDLVDEGNPARALVPTGVNGGIPLFGSFAAGSPAGEAQIVTTLLAGNYPLNVSNLEDVVFKFDARGLMPSATVSVALEDDQNNSIFQTFEPSAEWENFSFPVGVFGADTTRLRRIVWRVEGVGGDVVDFAIDNPEFVYTDGIVQPTPTYYPTPTPTPFPTPTDTVPPTYTPIPTSTPEVPMTPTPGPTPTPQTPIETPTPAVTPAVTPTDPDNDDEAMEEDDAPKTQVTFYCCAASALIPYTGTTSCDDDENVDQMRLRECLDQALTDYVACELNHRKLLAELDRLVNGMEGGYDTLFGTVVINGQRVPLIVNGSLFGSFPWGTGASASASVGGKAATNLLQTAATGVESLSAVDAALQSGSSDALLGAVVNSGSAGLTNIVNHLMLLDDVGEGGSQLTSRAGFSNAWTAANIAANIYKTVNAGKAFIDGYYLVEPLADEADLEGNRCARLFQKLRDLRKCEKGSNTWENCFSDPKDGGKAWRALEAEGLFAPDIQRKGEKLRAAIARQRDSAQFIADFAETNHTTMELFRECMEISVEMEEALAAGASFEELRVMALNYSEKYAQSMNGFLFMGNNLDELNDAINVASEGLEVIDMAREYRNDAAAALDAISAQNELEGQGDPNVIIKIAGQSTTSARKSTVGGKFVSYKHVTVSRTDDAVIFAPSDEMITAGMNDTIFSGATMVSFPEVTYEFTPFSTVEYDSFIQAPPITMQTNVNDLQETPPMVELTSPDPALSKPLAIPPGAPFYLGATATDDVVVFSTRFLIDGEPTEALGTKDNPKNPTGTTFGAYYIAPRNLENRAPQTLTVQAQAIDSGGNIGQSDLGSIVVDPDAELLATITPGNATAYVDGPSVSFSATVTASGDPLGQPIWFVDGIQGGNEIVGTINSFGAYTPPENQELLVKDHVIQVLSDSNPELYGEAMISVSFIQDARSSVSVLNMTPPGATSGRSTTQSVSVLGAFSPDFRAGMSYTEPISIYGNFVNGSALGTAHTDPVSVDQQEP